MRRVRRIELHPAATALLLVLMLVCHQAMAIADSHSIGVARDSKSQAVMYIEHHEYFADGSHRITYMDRDGETIKTTSLTYPGLPQHPRIQQNDVVRDEAVELVVVDNLLKVVQTRGEQMERFDLPVDAGTIVDAGFDPFIRENFEEFTDGKPRRFRFAAAGERRILSVDIVRTPLGEGLHEFTITPSNFLVRLLVPKLRVTYDDRRRLEKYEGPTNLELVDADVGTVEISFTHYASVGDPVGLRASALVAVQGAASDRS